MTTKLKNTQTPSSSPISLEGIEKLLLCEGSQDEKIITSLLENLQIEDIKIFPYGGIDKLLPQLQALMSSSNFSNLTSIGITRDADKDSLSAFKSVCTILKKAKLAIPKSINTITVSPDSPKINIFILPDCKNQGAMEHLCLKSLPENELQCVNNFLNCMENNSKSFQNFSKAQLNAWKSFKKAEAEIDAWLATQKKPVRLGEGAAKGYLDFSHPAFNLFKTFLQKL